MERKPDFVLDVVKITCGILLANFVMWISVQAWLRYQLREFTAAVDSSFQVPSVTNPPQPIRLPPPSDQAPQREAQSERERLQLQQLAIAAQSKKEAAWRRYFKPSPQCERESSVTCGNDYMRARREFEERYTNGELN